MTNEKKYNLWSMMLNRSQCFASDFDGLAEIASHALELLRIRDEEFGFIISELNGQNPKGFDEIKKFIKAKQKEIYPDTHLSFFKVGETYKHESGTLFKLLSQDKWKTTWLKEDGKILKRSEIITYVGQLDAHHSCVFVFGKQYRPIYSFSVSAKKL